MSMGIYKITNQINGKIYIGQSVNIEQRWKRHKQEAKNGNKTYKLYNAIRKYNIENFSFEIIEECSIDELNEKEIYYIEKYNSYYDGYNSTLGGQGKTFQRRINPQEIYDLWDQGLSVAEIIEKLKGKAGHSTIYNYLKLYENYTTSESNRRGIIADKRLIGNTIKQYDLWGNFIAEYTSYAEAERKTGVNKDTIGRVINKIQDQAGGYQWIADDSEPVDLTKRIRLKFGVIQYDLEGNEIKRFLNLTEAANEMGCSNDAIGKVCKHQRKTSCGYKWEFDYSIWNSQKRK